MYTHNDTRNQHKKHSQMVPKWFQNRLESGLTSNWHISSNWWTQTPEKGPFRRISTYFLDIWASLCPKPARNAFFTLVFSHTFPNASKMVFFCSKFALKVHLWSVLGKITPRNDVKTHENEWKDFPRGSGSILELKTGQNDEFLSHVHPSKSTSRRCQGAIRSVIMCPDYRDRPSYTYFCVFSSFLSVILPQTDQIYTFYVILSSKLPSGLIIFWSYFEESFHSNCHISVNFWS